MVSRRLRVLAPWAVLLLALQPVAGASHVVVHHRSLEAAQAAPTGDRHYFQPPRKWMKATTAAAPAPAPCFCGSAAAGSSCGCSVEDEKKLREAFVAVVKAHGYHDAECRSQLKAYICAVCLLPSAPPAAEPFSNRTNDNSSLPLGCAAAPATPSISIHDLMPASTEPPTPEEWLLADDNKAPMTPKWLIALLVSVLSALGGFITYKIRKARLEGCTNNQCCSNIKCCLCFL